jgi:hypothetical protein
MYGFVTRFYESISGARRAPTASSIEDDLCILRKLTHALFKLRQWNVNRPGNDSAFLEL